MSNTPGSLDKPASGSSGGTTSNWTEVELTADAEITNDDSFTDLTEFDLSIGIGEMIIVRTVLAVVSDSAADIKFTVTGPTGSLGKFSSGEEISSRTLGDTRGMATSGQTTPNVVELVYSANNPTNAGTMSIRFAQLAAHASTTKIKKGSRMFWRKITF